MSGHRQKRESAFRAVLGVTMGHTMIAQLLPIFLILVFLAGCAAQPVRIATPSAVPEEVEAPPTYVEIDASAFRHNVAVFKDLLEDDQLLCAVIKTDAYYLGVEHVVAAAVAEGAERLCFVSNAEAWYLADYALTKSLVKNEKRSDRSA